ncbi:MAG: Flp pilus assembly protein CpaB [Chloroflexota bacterium]
MRRSGRLFIVLGVGLALVAVVLIAVVLMGGDDPDDEAADSTDDGEPQEITVIVAARDVPAHTVLTQDDLVQETAESDTVPDDALRNPVEAVGYAYSQDLVEGQTLVESDREQPGLANSIESGQRAVTLNVTQDNLVAGQLRDDDHVDIVFTARIDLLRVNPTYPVELPDELSLQDIEEGESTVEIEGEETQVQTPGIVLPDYGDEGEFPTYPYHGDPGSRFWITDMEEGEPVGKLMLQNVPVLRVVTPSLGETGTGEESDSSFVILSLSPGDAELVEYLEAVGDFELLLRGPEDEDVVETPGVTLNGLMEDWGLEVPQTVRLPEEEGQ